MDSSSMMMTEDGNNTLFLLHRLQELKLWQKEQEIKLNEENPESPHRSLSPSSLTSSPSVEGSCEEDDTTIEQDLSYHDALEERPIGFHKPFEELLREELGKEKEFPLVGFERVSSPKRLVRGRRPFLRKGSGLVRFLSSPKKAHGDEKRGASSSGTSKGVDEDEENDHLVLDLSDSVKIIRPSNENSFHSPRHHIPIPEEDEITVDDYTEVCDSVELSFMQKIKTLQKKEQEELAAFEILEEAAVDTSFCSNSSVVRKLIQSAASKDSVTSTPKRKGTESRNTYTLPQNDIGSSRSLSLEDDEEESESTLRNDDNKTEKPPKIDSTSFLCETPNILSFIENREPAKKSRNGPVPEVNNKLPNGKFQLKFSELEEEILKYKHESVKLQKQRSGLMAEKRRFASEIEGFQRTQEEERRKLDEERRRIKRDERLLEKTKRDISASSNSTTSKEIQFIQNKMKLLQGDFNKKESRWNNTYKKLQDKVKSLEKENQQLHEENHQLKLRRASSKVYKDFKKVSDKHLDDEESEDKVEPRPPKSPERLTVEKVDSILDRASPKLIIHGDNDDNNSNNLKRPPKSPLISNRRPSKGSPVFKLGVQKVSESHSEALPFTYSGVDSLESDITLVDAGSLSSKAPEQQSSSAAKLLDVKHNSTKGTTEKTYSDGTLEVSYANGNRKEIREGVVKVFYYNGDVKISEEADGTVKYYYSKTKTWHLTYPDKEVFKFDNGQQEKRFKDGTHEIIFTDGSVKKVLPNGAEIIIFPDQTRVNVNPEGHKVISFPNGQVETHLPEYKKRQYLDGTVKILHNDGRQETRYANGRVRIKNQEGNLIYDSNEGN